MWIISNRKKLYEQELVAFIYFYGYLLESLLKLSILTSKNYLNIVLYNFLTCGL